MDATNPTPNPVIERLRAELSPVFPRTEAAEKLGKSMSAGHLANLDSRGDGPPLHYLGRKAVYERESFLAWLEPRLTRAKAKPVGVIAGA